MLKKSSSLFLLEIDSNSKITRCFLFKKEDSKENSKTFFPKINEMPTKFSKLIEFRWNCAAGFGFEVGKVGFELNDSSSDPAFCLMRKFRKFERNGFEQSQF